jgi:hypothetical protein
MACLRHAAVYSSDGLKVGCAISFARQTRPIDGGCHFSKDFIVIVETRKAASCARNFCDGYYYRGPQCARDEKRAGFLGAPTATSGPGLGSAG